MRKISVDPINVSELVNQALFTSKFVVDCMGLTAPIGSLLISGL